jgi:hypothetical protein
MMVTLSHDAQGLLDRYLHRVRLSLRGHTSLDVDDIERDVRGHIDAALEGQPEPIDAGSLRPILDRLGAPDKWAPADDLPWWRRALVRLSSGPEDWRLPYLTFLCFLAGPTLFLVGDGRMLWPLPVILVMASFMLARASLSVLAHDTGALAERRWLIYPPLVLVYVPLGLALLGWPMTLVAVANDDQPAIAAWTSGLLREPFEVNLAVTIALAVGVWWIGLGLLVARYGQAVRAVFWPFAERITRRHAIGVMAAGGTLVAAAAVAIAALR